MARLFVKNLKIMNNSDHAMREQRLAGSLADQPFLAALNGQS
jgi:hypothetical protein